MRVRALFLAGLAALLLAAPAQADVWNVTNGSSDATTTCNTAAHTCVSLRAAIAASEATKDVPDTINVPAGTININNDLVIQSDITVVGASARTNIIDGGFKARGFRITPSGNAKLSHFTIRDAAAGHGGSPDGGGILNRSGVAQLSFIRVTTSHAALLGSGGGIANVEGAMTLNKVLVDNNTAANGAGIANVGGAESADRGLLGLVDSTVFHNTAGLGGTGGIDSRGGQANVVLLNRTTVADNVGGLLGLGGLQILSGAAQALTSIIARNTVWAASANCGDVKPTSSSNNVENERECGFETRGVNPGLATALSNAGGELDVLALTAASPAVDRGATGPCGANVSDQRGLARPQGPACDAGAFEREQAPTVAITAGPTGTIAVRNAAFAFTTTEPGVTVQCRLTGPGQSNEFVTCEKPTDQGYSALADGNYTFSVRALDGVNANPPISTRTFTVDATLETTITGGPSGPIADTTPTFTFTSTGSGGAASFECRVDTGAFATCTSPHTTAALTQGAHTFQVRAMNAAGASDTTPASRSFTVDTVAPGTQITGGPEGPTNVNAPSFSFTADKPASTFQCKLDGPGAATQEYAACGSPVVYPGLADGAYAFSVRAVDTLGNIDPTAATRAFTVDTTPPAAEVLSGPEGTTTDSSPAFTFSTAGAETVTCRLDGPAPAIGAFGPCVSPKSFSALEPGDYVFIVRSVDAAGNANETRRAFTVTVPRQATPTPTPTPAPTPTFHQSVVVAPGGGRVLVRLKGAKTFELLDITKGIPLGSEVDARNGKVRLTSIPKAGATPETADFFDGMFTVHQVGDITDLRLSEKLTGCNSSKKKKASAAATKPKSRKLWGDGKGKFRTKGQFSSATVRGTKWLVQDTCTFTLTRVTQGVVAVNDLAKKKTVLVKQGKRYTARPKKR